MKITSQINKQFHQCFCWLVYYLSTAKVILLSQSGIDVLLDDLEVAHTLSQHNCSALLIDPDKSAWRDVLVSWYGSLRRAVFHFPSFPQPVDILDKVSLEVHIKAQPHAAAMDLSTCWKFGSRFWNISAVYCPISKRISAKWWPLTTHSCDIWFQFLSKIFLITIAVVNIAGDNENIPLWVADWPHWCDFRGDTCGDLWWSAMLLEAKDCSKLSYFITTYGRAFSGLYHGSFINVFRGGIRGGGS